MKILMLKPPWIIYFIWRQMSWLTLIDIDWTMVFYGMYIIWNVTDISHAHVSKTVHLKQTRVIFSNGHRVNGTSRFFIRSHIFAFANITMTSMAKRIIFRSTWEHEITCRLPVRFIPFEIKMCSDRHQTSASFSTMASIMFQLNAAYFDLKCQCNCPC